MILEQNLQNVLDILREFSTPDRPIYLVGGAVRDLLVNRKTHDLDFVLPGETRSLAREISCRLNGALYRLDEERDTTRVILDSVLPNGGRMLLDFASLRGNDLESDLRARDFTVNAMAFDVSHPDRLVDPTGGLADLKDRLLRACSPTSLSSDPVRVLRAVRIALDLNMRILPETTEFIRAAAPLLHRVSAERQRDELFRMLDGAQVSQAVRILDRLGALAQVLPETVDLKNVTQPSPHTQDVWEHTISTVQYLEQLLPPLVGSYREENVPDLMVGSAVLWLGRFRDQLDAHFSQRLVTNRSLRSLLFLAALYHDIAKPETRAQGPSGKIHFRSHDVAGAKKAVHRARELALSAAEVSRLEIIIENHLRIHAMSGAFASNKQTDEDGKPTRRAIYRFFHDTGPAGVDICLLSLADLRGTYGTSLPAQVWEAELRTCRDLFEAYWEKSDEVVSPPRFLTGDDLIGEFGFGPGKHIGRILSAIREAQGAGEIHDRQEALEYARRWLEKHPLNDEQHAREEGER